VNVFIEVDIENSLCYRLKTTIPDHTGSWKDKAELRKMQTDWIASYLRKNIIPFFNKPYMQCFIVLESKMNTDGTSTLHP
jgi:hypothetical protein